MWLRTVFAGAVAVALCGCSSEPITETAFQRAAGDASSIMSAAAYTIDFIHRDPARLTVEYGQASLVNYLEQVSATPDELATLDGAPDEATVDGLAEQLRTAISDLQNACLVPDCDWQGQVLRLKGVSTALAQATE